VGGDLSPIGFGADGICIVAEIVGQASLLAGFSEGKPEARPTKEWPIKFNMLWQHQIIGNRSLPTREIMYEY
jgi:hypothetical protein